MNKELNIQKDGKPCIYCIKNLINNKVYIGSAIGHYRRKGQHYYMLRRNNHFNIHLQSSWNKYGEINFKFIVLEFIENVDFLEERETYWIKEYNSLNNKHGYNARVDCKTNLKLKWPEESKRKFSLSKKGKRIPHIDYNKIAENLMKSVTGINIKTNEILIFKSAKEAGSILNIEKTGISKALHKHIKSSGGFIWYFTEQSVSNNSVNSGEVLKDNPDPSLMNDNKVIKKEQRLMGEESTNNPNTSAEQPTLVEDIV